MRFLGKLNGKPGSGNLIPMTAKEGAQIEVTSILNNINQHRPNLLEEIRGIVF